VGFKGHLANQVNPKTKTPLSASTRHAITAALKAFFIWLADQPGYKSRVSYADAEYFNVSAKDAAIAKTSRERPIPTLDQIIRLLDTMPASTVVERRNRAVVALTILTGSRDGATASLRLKHINLNDDCLTFDAREVDSKFSKSFKTWFFPVGEHPRQMVEDWLMELNNGLCWGPDDPLFPSTEIGIGKAGGFQPIGVKRAFWSSAQPIRTIFKQACSNAGFPYFNPHSFRNTLAQLGEQVCRTPEAFKAWSQNLGHEHVLTTLNSYGAVPAQRQAAIIRGLAVERDDPPAEVIEIARTLHAKGYRE
jgi:integrase